MIFIYILAEVLHPPVCVLKLPYNQVLNTLSGWYLYKMSTIRLLMSQRPKNPSDRFTEKIRLTRTIRSRTQPTLRASAQISH